MLTVTVRTADGRTVRTAVPKPAFATFVAAAESRGERVLATCGAAA